MDDYASGWDDGFEAGLQKGKDELKELHDYLVGVALTNRIVNYSFLLKLIEKRLEEM
jgi:hypothetical protein